MDSSKKPLSKMSDEELMAQLYFLVIQNTMDFMVRVGDSLEAINDNLADINKKLQSFSKNQ